MKPWMHNKEIAKIEQYLAPNDIMLEWGSGGSTLRFSKLVGKYYSIEHKKEWYDKLNIENNYVFRYLVPKSKGNNKKEMFDEYIKFPSKLDVKQFDKVLIDGRARFECAKYILPFISRSGIVFIHDFFQPHKYDDYARVFSYYNLIDSVEDTQQTLAILKKK